MKAPSTKPGEFYLGALMSGEQPGDEPLIYPARDLVTHGVCIGMTGSGKTGLCIGLLEECALNGIPVIAIDPKGDMANLALAFDGPTAEELLPWINPDAARLKGIAPEELAAQEAQAWAQGRADWGIGPERVNALREKAEFKLFTPGSAAGDPLNILQSFDPPGDVRAMAPEDLREQAAASASALLGLLGGKPASEQSREHILLSTLLLKRWAAGEKTDLATLIGLIRQPGIERLGVLPLEEFFPAKDRQDLALSLNALLAAPAFQDWLQGEPLDPARMLYAPDGRPRLAVCSIAHLDDNQRMFFVALLLSRLIGWMRAQPGSTTLRALLYFDEVFGYLPPHPKDPPSKHLLLLLLKQARAFGLGVMMVTQNPVDLDYKALANCGTWLIGRLQTERDKARILEGLEGAAQESGGKADRAVLDGLLASLRQRVFLLHNVHRGVPTVFHARWAMSYLAGPITPAQFKRLPGASRKPTPSAGGASLQDFIGSAEAEATATPPPAPAGLTVRFARTGGEIMAPSIYARADILFRDTKSGESVTLRRLTVIPEPADAAAASWARAEELDPEQECASEPPRGARFAALAGPCQDVALLKALGRSYANHLLETVTLELFECPGLKLRSAPKETREAFADRARLSAEEAAAAAEKEEREDHAKKRAALEAKLRKEQDEMARDQERANMRKAEETASTASAIGGVLLSLFGKGRGSAARRVGSALSSATSKRGITKRAEMEVEESRQTIAELERQIAESDAALEQRIAARRAEIESAAAKIVSAKVLPQKSGIQVAEFGILWRQRGSEFRLQAGP